MPLLYSPRYRSTQGYPPISPGVLDEDDDSMLNSGFAPNQSASQLSDFQAPNTQANPSPALPQQPPKLTNAQAGAAAQPLTPLGTMPVAGPPPNPRRSASAASSAPATVSAPAPPPPAPTDTQADMAEEPASDANGTSTPATPQTTEDKLNALQAPASPKSNVMQRIALAALAMTRFAPIAPMLVHPIYAEQRAGYTRQRADLENQLGEDKIQAGIDTEKQRAGAYAAAQQANSEYRKNLVTERTNAALDRSEMQFMKNLPGSMPLPEGQQAPTGWTTVTSPFSGTQYTAPPTSIPIPNDPDILKKFGGSKPGDLIPSSFYMKAQEAVWAEQLAHAKADDKPQKETEDQWIATANDPNASAEDRATAKANLQAAVRQKQAGRPVTNISTGAASDPAQVTYWANQIQRDGKNWSLVQGDKALAAAVRTELATRGVNPNNIDAQTRDAAMFAHTLQPHLDKIDQEIDTLDKAGALGPVTGRWNEFLTGKVGAGSLVGDPQTANTLQQLRTDMALAKTALGRIHGGARGGASPYMIEHFNSLLNSSTMDAQTLKSGMKAVHEWVNGYANMVPDTQGGQPASNKIRVRRLSDGQSGTLDPGDFDASKYERIQ